MPLLRTVWEAGKEAGATIFSTWSSVDSAAMATYMKLGMLPGCQILLFEGTARQLPEQDPAYSVERLEQSHAMVLDQKVRGTGRGVDHELWSNGAGLQGRQVIRAGEVVGYYYLSRAGIGPAAWKSPEHGEPVMVLACQEAADSASPVRLAIPGYNHAGLRFALDSGLQLTSFAHFLTSAPFGRLDQYLASGPGLF